MGGVEDLPFLASTPSIFREVALQYVPHRALGDAQDVGDPPPSLAALPFQLQQLLLNLRWGTVGECFGRQERSESPSFPSHMYRRTHLRTVLRVVESLLAVFRMLPQDPTILSRNITLPSWVGKK
jgi:hypothetical protein